MLHRAVGLVSHIWAGDAATTAALQDPCLQAQHIALSYDSAPAPIFPHHSEGAQLEVTEIPLYIMSKLQGTVLGRE